MAYHIDLTKITIPALKEKLRKTRLVPSRMPLLEHLDTYFFRIQQMGIEHAGQLLEFINTNKKIRGFSADSQIPEEYLVLLSREMRSALPKVNHIIDFPNIKPEQAAWLKRAGISDARQLWERSISPAGREALARTTAIDIERLEEWAGQSDLCRVRWVNAHFAHILQQAGIPSVRALVKADPVKLCATVNDVNNLNKWFKGKIGLNDFYRITEAAADLSLELDI